MERQRESCPRRVSYLIRVSYTGSPGVLRYEPDNRPPQPTVIPASLHRIKIQPRTHFQVVGVLDHQSQVAAALDYLSQVVAVLDYLSQVVAGLVGQVAAVLVHLSLGHFEPEQE